MKVPSDARQTAPHGGQASLGLFGVAGFEARQQQPTRRPHASRIKGALNSFDSDGLNAAHYVRPSAPAPSRRPSLHDEPELAHSRWLAELAEAHGCPFDEEDAAYARSFVGAGHAEHIMALEG